MNQQVMMRKLMKMKQEMEETQEEIQETEFEASSSGIVKVTVMGTKEIASIEIDESFEELQDLKKELALVEKENSQLELAIESNLNLSNIEQQAKELLGMQKLTNAQTIYISLPKKDYIETSVEAIVVENESVLEKIKDKIKKWF